MPPLFEKIDSNYFFDRTSFFLRFFLAQVDFIFPTVDCRFPTVGKPFPTVGKNSRLSGKYISKKQKVMKNIVKTMGVGSKKKFGDRNHIPD